MFHTRPVTVRTMGCRLRLGRSIIEDPPVAYQCDPSSFERLLMSLDSYFVPRSLPARATGNLHVLPSPRFCCLYNSGTALTPPFPLSLSSRLAPCSSTTCFSLSISFRTLFRCTPFFHGGHVPDTATNKPAPPTNNFARRGNEIDSIRTL